MNAPFRKGCPRCTKLSLLQGLREVIGRQHITPNFFKGDADSQMQTRGISFCLEDTCHCTKTRPLRKWKKYSIIKIVTPTDFCSNTPRILTNKISQNEHRLRLHSQDPKGKWKERTQIDCITGIELFNHLKV